MNRALWLVVCSALAGAPAAALAAAQAPAPYRGVVASSGLKQAASRSALCAACHGPRGNSVSSQYPNLAGQNYNYLLKELEDFRSGRRQATPMGSLMKTVPPASGDQNLKVLAAYYAAQSLDRKAGANATEPKPDQAVARAGYRLYMGGDSSEGVPACAACHMPSGQGNAPMAIPALAGQHADYVKTELQRFADGKRDNSLEHIMGLIAKRLTARQIAAVADYVQELRPKLTIGVGPRGYAAYVAAQSEQPVPGIPASGLSAAKAAGGDPGGQ